MQTRILTLDCRDMLIVGPGETALLEVIQVIDDEPDALVLTEEEAKFLRDQLTVWLEEQ